ncbi:MAG TPA: hypothetical protein VFP25_00460 [Nitrososphaeraceae archaeon]|nr:hypothetical protein [Nitrososphaeraceae archaeon]
MTLRKDIKLIIFPIHRHLLKDIKVSIIKTLKSNNVKSYKITTENSFLVLATQNYLYVFNILSTFLGIKKIGLAVSTSNNIKNILSLILSVTKNIILYNERFQVKVVSENPDFISRDVEFMATGLIIDKTKYQSLKTNNSKGMNIKKIYCFIGKLNSYILIKLIDGIGGLPFNYNKKKIFSIYYNDYSLNSIKTISNFGFIPEILIVYSNSSDLTKKLKLPHPIFSKMGNRRISIRLLSTDLKFTIDGCQYEEFLILKSIIMSNNHRNVLVPFSFYTHPFWMMEKIINLCYKNNKIPWIPMAFSDPDECIDLHFKNNDLIKNFENKINKKIRTGNISGDKKSLFRFSFLRKEIKNVTFVMNSSNIRPNYIDNILNSV